MNKIPNYGNKLDNNSNLNIKGYLQQKNNLRKRMDELKQEIAKDMGYNQIKIPNGSDMTSREIGIYAGPVGGAIVKDLIANAEQILIKQYKDK